MAGVKKFGHNLEAALKDADVAVEWDSCNLYDQLRAGIFLNKGTQKYWLDEKTGHNSYILYARGLSITWSEDPKYWKWIPMKDASDSVIEVAELVMVSWLHINGRISISILSPRVLYLVTFLVLIKEEASGWQYPVNIELRKSNVIIDEHKRNILEFPREQWVEISVGTFRLRDSDNSGSIEFSMYEHGGHLKRGLVVKAAVIRPI